MVQVPTILFASRQGTATARTTSVWTVTGNPACSPKAVRRSLRDMLGVDREARAVLYPDVLARQEDTVLTF